MYNEDLKPMSEQVVIEAPLSFTGSAKRLWKLTGVDNDFVKWLLLVPVALVLITVAWFVIVFWYLILGLWLVPYRLLRRSSRKNKRDKLRHREVLDAIERQND